MDETCPKCDARFPGREALARNPALEMLTGIGALDTRVRCPRCGNVFESESIRFFGFLSPRGLKILVGALFAAIVLGVVWAFFFQTA